MLRLRLLPLVSLLALTAALGGACFNSVNKSKLESSTGTGGSPPDAGSGGGGGAGGGGGGGVVFPDAGAAPVVTVASPGQMVLDGDSLVLTSLDTLTGIGSLVRVAIGSWTVTPILTGSTALSVAYALTADTQSFYFFAADDQGNNAVYAYPRAGGTAPVMLAAAGNVTGSSAAASIAVDATRIYWVQFATDPTQAGGTVMAAPIGGGTAVELASINAPEEPSGGIAVDATQLYWTTSVAAQLEGAVYAMPLSPPTPPAQPLSIYSGSAPQWVASDGTSAYVLDVGLAMGDCAPSSGSLVVIPLAGGATKTLIDTLYGAVTFALDGGQAYIATGSSCEGTSPNGTVLDVPLDGGSITGLATGPWQPITLVVDGATLYVSEDSGKGGLLQIAK
jgi:hypothetical protein